MQFSKREIELITYALHGMESECIAEVLDSDTERELGGTPDWSEIRELMDKFKTLGEPVGWKQGVYADRDFQAGWRYFKTRSEAYLVWCDQPQGVPGPEAIYE